MAVRVVDRLEMIDVAQRDRRGAVFTSAHLGGLAQARVEGAAIGQAGEMIDLRLALGALQHGAQLGRLDRALAQFFLDVARLRHHRAGQADQPLDRGQRLGRGQLVRLGLQRVAIDMRGPTRTLDQFEALPENDLDLLGGRGDPGGAAFGRRAFGVEILHPVVRQRRARGKRLLDRQRELAVGVREIVVRAHQVECRQVEPVGEQERADLVEQQMPLDRAWRLSHRRRTGRARAIPPDGMRAQWMVKRLMHVHDS